ncbi:MAG: S24/S26 family peptidase [Synergistaceae bacterium]|nr:S24/S26 family peptidase [Synergistaceae bacterium]
MNFSEYLDLHGTLTYTNVGTSMLPLLCQGRDLFTITKKSEARCKRGDVVLYERPPGKYILHRVIEVREKDYIILGDNCISKEYGITDKNILGIMTSYTRSGVEHSINSLGYKIYTFLIMHTIGARIFLKKLLYKFKRIIKIFIYHE